MATSTKGFKEADVIVERSFKTEATHQGYIEPHACLASVGPDGQGELWVCTQGHYMVRNTCAALLGIDVSQAPRHRRPRSAAASAARPPCSSSRWRWRCRARPAGRSRW